MSFRRRKNTIRTYTAAEQLSPVKRLFTGRYFGIALIFVFMLVPVLFMILHFRSDKAHDSQPSHADEINETIVLGRTSESLSDEHSQQTADLDRENRPEQVPGQSFSDAPEEETAIEIIGVAYLTFDDGPSLTVTPAILDTLAQEGVKATFFTLPYSGADDIFKRIINEGHEIGNHSYSHKYPTLYEGSVGAFREDIQRARRFIDDSYGYRTTSFRFPGGSGDQTRSVLSPRIDVIKELGYRHFDWDIDTNDWRQGRSAEDIINDVLDNTHGREHVIILMHDVYDITLEALPGIIDGLREQGYEFGILRKYP